MAWGCVGAFGPNVAPVVFKYLCLGLGVSGGCVIYFGSECGEWSFGGGECRVDLVGDLSGGSFGSVNRGPFGSVRLLSVVRGDTGPRVPIFEEFGNSVSEVGGSGRGYVGLSILFGSRGSIVLRRQCFESKDGGVEFAESVCVFSFLV